MTLNETPEETPAERTPRPAGRKRDPKGTKERSETDRMLNRRQDVRVLSYPKSGRTWLGLMATWYVAHAIDRPDACWTVHKALESMTPWRAESYVNAVLEARNKGRWAPLIQFRHFAAYSQPYYQRPRIKKSGAERNIVLFRDPRDVVVSYYHHLVDYRRGRVRLGEGAPSKLPKSYSLPEFVYSETLGFRKIVAYMAAAAGWAERSAAPIVHYEDIRSDPAAGLRTFLVACGIETPDQNLIARAVEACSFDRLKAAEAQSQGAAERKSLRVRKGVVGGHREELDDREAEFMDAVLTEVGHPALARYLPN